MPSPRKRRPAPPPPPPSASPTSPAPTFEAHPPSQQQPQGRQQRVLFVIAHPDDETMFFSPTMAYYRRQGSAMSMLCVSTGKAGICLQGKGERWDVFDVPWSWRLMQPQYSPTPTFWVTGDYYGQGAERRRELEEACRLLGIPADRLTLLDDKDLRVSACLRTPPPASSCTVRGGQ